MTKGASGRFVYWEGARDSHEEVTRETQIHDYMSMTRDMEWPEKDASRLPFKETDLNYLKLRYISDLCPVTNSNKEEEGQLTNSR